EQMAALRQPLVVGGDRPRLAAGAEVLAGIEAERRGPTHRSGFPPAPLLPREVFSAVRLAGVLDDHEVVPGRQLENRIHIGDLPVQVHRDQGRDRAPGAMAHETAGDRVGCTPGLEVRPERLGVHRVRSLIDVDEIRPGPAWEIASVVAMKVSGTVTTVSPARTPAAMSAKRNASVPLAIPTQNGASQNSAKSRSNSRTTGPPMKPAVSSAVSNTERSSSRNSRCTVTRSRNGISGVLIGSQS